MACYTKRVSCHGEGWKVGTWPEQENHKDEGSMEASELDNDDSIKLKLTMLMLVEGELHGYPRTTEEDGQVTPAPPKFKQDLEAILHMAEGELPRMRCIRSKITMTANYYGFGDALSGGFGVTVPVNNHT